MEACINAFDDKGYDCWSVEFITNVDPTTSTTNCRTQIKTLFGSNTGYVKVTNTDLYERSCRYVDYMGVNKQPEQNVPYHVIHTPYTDPTPYGADLFSAARFDVEYEAKKNDAIKPYFRINFSPFPDTCIINCKIDLIFTVDGKSCSLLWDPTLDTTSGGGRWSP